MNFAPWPNSRHDTTTIAELNIGEDVFEQTYLMGSMVDNMT